MLKQSHDEPDYFTRVASFLSESLSLTLPFITMVSDNEPISLNE